MEVADFRSGYGFVLTCSISKVGSITGSLTQLRMMQPGGRCPPLWACERMVHLQNQTYCQGQKDIIVVVVIIIVIVVVLIIIIIIIIIIITIIITIIKFTNLGVRWFRLRLEKIIGESLEFGDFSIWRRAYKVDGFGLQHLQVTCNLVVM